MHILFDLDGTLTDSRDGIVRSICYALEKLDIPRPSDEELNDFIGPPLQHSLKVVLGIDDERLTEGLVTHYRERYRKLGMYENTVYPHVPEMLELLGDRASLYVATSKPQVFANEIIRHFELRRFFAGVYGSELDGGRFDKVELISYILERENLSKDATSMIGDRQYDVAGAVANGVLPVGALWGYGSRQELQNAGATVFCPQPADLPEVLNDNFFRRDA